MGVIQTNCPHCGTASVGMHTFGAMQLRPETAATTVIIPEFLAAAACPLCSRPVCAHVKFLRHPGNGLLVAKMIEDFQKNPRTADSLGLTVQEIWPKAVGPTTPADIPAASAQAFLQAERNYLQRGNEDAAAIMYRKALETALKTKYPEKTGSLAKRIDDLVQERIVPKDIGIWAHEIRVVGNDGAHDLEGINRNELDAMRGFTDAVLRYLFTLPAQVAARQVAQ